ncbi:threonine--tRNA ligase [Sodalis sp. CWE]|uniref:threonine--tRNA ligase n=1 Tax=Sodalis sp. CWE TaxID=2803816 RepID=UPI001C7DD14C|nr:threonine--tRNA ligase [Sodalis sp. CWE]MBX4180909.1 threonine--tRNA ligase [Sodalis sp. CWE]
MPVIILPNGSQHRFAYPVSILDIAKQVNPDLARGCIAGLVNGKLTDAIDIIESDYVQLVIINYKDDAGLKIIRYSCAHLLGYAIKQLWPEAKMVTGSVINKRFYYDIDLDYNLAQSDLCLLEAKMKKLASKAYAIRKQKVNWKQAREIFLARNECYKVAILDQSTNPNNSLSLYYHNEYVEICRGPHVPNIGFCRFFSLQEVSSIHWLKNKENKILQRIYGMAWNDKQHFNAYLHSSKERIERDHRKIGKQLDLYHIQKEAPGMVFWHNNGWIIFRELETFICTKLKSYSYQEVKGPFMMDRILWEKTGHLESYVENIYITSSEDEEYCIKPMNCPGHVQIFNQSLKSYRDLPLRMAEFGSCHRKEPSGSLHGLMRLRNFTQDDAHIFCTEEQVCDEVDNCIRMIYDVYETFGFKRISVKLSTRPEKRIGSDEIWNKAEQNLITALKKNNISFGYQYGEGAFYGPKIDFTLLDSLNRTWQCGTIQLDFSLPIRLNATYIGKNKEKLIPVMIHRAILGSMERFIGILTEEYAGYYPTWLAPVQVVVMSITDDQSEYVKNITERLSLAGIRAKADLRNKRIGFKIREHTLLRVPYMLICGKKEIKNKKVTVRTQHNKNLGDVDAEEIIAKIAREIFNRNLHQLEE